MINPKEITNYNRTEAELEEFLLFAVVVAGKNSKVQAKKLDCFLKTANQYANEKSSYELSTPFQWICVLASFGVLGAALNRVKIGQYNRIKKCFSQLSVFNIKSLGFDELVSISGIGPKTANFFLLHTQKDYNEAVLDTHILKWLRSVGYDKAPKTTPSNLKTYRMWSLVFKNTAKNIFPSLTLAEADLNIWKQFNKS